MQWVYILTPSGLLADAHDQESFDLGLSFFELMTFNIFIVYTIDSYVEQTYLYKELRFGVQSTGKKKSLLHLFQCIAPFSCIWHITKYEFESYSTW